MSNLTLATEPTHENLTAMRHPSGRRKLAPNTYSHRHDSGVHLITYYRTIIAEIGEDYVIIANGGYGTVTTNTRLNKILRANRIPYRVHRKNYTVMVSNNVTSTPLYAPPTYGVRFDMIEGEWVLSA